ncbi:MAG: WD40/YVTN/BNR-like repeat-containing protein [Actinomycetota bacterium]
MRKGPDTPRRRRAVPLAALALLALLATACADRGGQASGPGRSATTFVHIHGVAVDPSDPSILWVATHRGLIRGSGDDTWSYASGDRNDYMGFTLDPTSGTVFRSGHPEAGGNLGVESSTDGRRWRRVATVLDPPVDFHAMTLSFADPKTMYGWDSGGRGLFRSTDGGSTWEGLSPEGLDPRVFSLAAPAQPSVVFTGTPSGLFRSDDAGATWRKVAGRGLATVAADPKDPNHVLAFLKGEGMRVSRDGGHTWSLASKGIPSGELIGALAISPQDPNQAYAAGPTTIYKTVDGGSSWTVIRSES